jgi:hypothetical protein
MNSELSKNFSEIKISHMKLFCIIDRERRVQFSYMTRKGGKTANVYRQ